MKNSEASPKIDTLSEHGRQVLNEVKTKGGGAFLSPEVIELHLSQGTPVPPGTTKLIWALNHGNA